MRVPVFSNPHQHLVLSVLLVFLALLIGVEGYFITIVMLYFPNGYLEWHVFLCSFATCIFSLVKCPCLLPICQFDCLDFFLCEFESFKYILFLIFKIFQSQWTHSIIVLVGYRVCKYFLPFSYLFCLPLNKVFHGAKILIFG